MTPFFSASCSILAPDAEFRSTIMSTLMPEDSIWRAMVCIFAGEPPAFWMLHERLYLAQSAFSAVGSAVTHRGEDVVSGRMMPTLAPLPSIAPPGADDDEDAGGADDDDVVDEPPAGGEELVPPLLELQPVRATAAATPTTAMDTVLLRMRSHAFPFLASSTALPCGPVNVVRQNISLGDPATAQRHQFVTWPV